MITKNLIFSHKSDIDGMGCVVLAKLALEEDASSKVDYVLCEGHNIDEVFEKYFLSQKLILYDRILVTDLHLNEDNLKRIDSNNTLKSKVKVIDHNDFALRYNNYDFVNIQTKLDNGLDSCATTLLYNYFLNEGLLKSNACISRFCEATRKQDTGTWELTVEGQANYARDLSILFGAIGQDRYIDIMYNKLRTNNLFFLDEPEQNIVYHKGELIKARIALYLREMKVKEIAGRKAGIFKIRYDDRNELAQYIRNNKEKYEVDFIVLIPSDKNSISLRNINPDCNVGKIAETMYGKGHFGAAGINITDSNKEELLQLFG